MGSTNEANNGCGAAGNPESRGTAPGSLVKKHSSGQQNSAQLSDKEYENEYKSGKYKRGQWMQLLGLKHERQQNTVCVSFFEASQTRVKELAVTHKPWFWS